MTTEISEYEKQAIDFLASTKTEFICKFLKHGKHFQDDKEERDIYEITLKRGQRSYTFNFGQSIANSGEWLVKDKLPKFTKVFNDKMVASDYVARITGNHFNVRKNPNKKSPTAYDVLACLTKYDPGTFENFCSEFGYDTDSRKAKKIYKAVLKEWQNIQVLFTNSEIELLAEIQ